MPRNAEEKLEHVKLKVFLYKYTPQFTRDNSAETKQKTLGKLDRYRIDLAENNTANQFGNFWKYDITDFVSSYSFNQDVDDNTYSWSMILQDQLLTFEDIDERLRVEGPKILDDSTALTRLAQFEAQAKELADQNFILEGKIRRGVSQEPLTIKVGDNLPTKEGLRLADIIQPYDMISCFLYKNNTPVSELRGSIDVSTSAKGLRTFKLAEKKTGLVGRFKSAFQSGQKLNSADLQKESILLSNTGGDRPLFNNEFNGFVSSKRTSVSAGGVDVINISGNGVSRLFGVTRRVLKPSLFQSSIYEIGELVNPGEVTAYQNIYANRTPTEIFADLFGIVYRIKFPTQKKENFLLARLFNQRTQASTTEFLGNNFYDIASLIVGNDLQTNMFTIPPFLLALVMKRRGFAYREPLNRASGNQLITNARNLSVRSSGEKEIIIQSQVDEAIDANSGLLDSKPLVDKSPIFFSRELDSLRPYFKLISNVFNFFNAELRTPFEIVDEIKDKTFLEFYERHDGIIIIRPPQFNDRTKTIFSSDLEVQSATYSETVDGLISRQKVGYGTDIIEQLEPIKEYSFGNGKLLIQFGFLEAGTDPNPNVKNDKTDDNEISETKESGLSKYAEYFLRKHNASLKTGSITANLDPRVRVGRTYFDEGAQKFGYITTVSKNVTVGGTVTMSFELAYVRDAYLADRIQIDAAGNVIRNQTGAAPISTVEGPIQLLDRKNRKDPRFIQVEQLPRLIDVAAGFTSGTVTDTVDLEPPLLTFTQA